MKKYIQLLTIALISIIFTGCTENDDEFYASKYVTSNGLIEVITTTSNATVSCNFARLLPQDTNPLDLYLTSTSEEFFFNYTLEKKNDAGNWEYVSSSNYTITNNLGSNQLGSYISAICQLDALESDYQYESVITPNTAGQYRLSVDNEIVSLDSKDAVTVTIKTTVIGSNNIEFTIL